MERAYLLSACGLNEEKWWRSDMFQSGSTLRMTFIVTC